MIALAHIGWFVWLLLAITAIYVTIGKSALTQMFPEGRRRWDGPLELLALAHFVAVIQLNPFR